MLITLPLSLVPPRISHSVAWHVVAAEKYATFLFHWLMLAFCFCCLLFVVCCLVFWLCALHATL